MDPITMGLIAAAKILSKPVATAIGDHIEANKRAKIAEEERKQEALRQEALSLGCTVAELPARKRAIARANELNCTLEELPKVEALANQWEQKMAAQQEQEKQRWINEQMNKNS